MVAPALEGGEVADAAPEGPGAVEVVDDPGDGPKEDAGPQGATKYGRLQEGAVSRQHLLIHVPRNPLCSICRRAKTSRTQRRHDKNKAYKQMRPCLGPKKFGGLHRGPLVRG
eukprot:1716759-Pyramimonas_sp.AAC.1